MQRQRMFNRAQGQEVGSRGLYLEAGQQKDPQDVTRKTCIDPNCTYSFGY